MFVARTKKSAYKHRLLTILLVYSTALSALPTVAASGHAHHHPPQHSSAHDLPQCIGDVHVQGPPGDTITLASSNCNGHFRASAPELLSHASARGYDILCVIETGADFHNVDAKAWRRNNSLQDYSTHSMGPPSPTHTTGGITFCVNTRMGPLVRKLVKFPQLRFCALHLSSKRGRQMVFVGVHAHPNPLDASTTLDAELTRAKVSEYIRSMRHQDYHVFLLGDLNCYATTDIDKNKQGPGAHHRYKPCIDDLITNNYMVDSFRHRFPTTPAYTYSCNSSTASTSYSRLDYVCMDEVAANALTKARIDYLLFSDHPGIAVAEFHMHPFWQGSLGVAATPARQHRTKHLNKEQWDTLPEMQNWILDFTSNPLDLDQLMNTDDQLDVALAQFFRFLYSTMCKAFPPVADRRPFRPPEVGLAHRRIRQLCSLTTSCRDKGADVEQVERRFDDPLLSPLYDDTAHELRQRLFDPDLPAEELSEIRVDLAEWSTTLKKSLVTTNSLAERKKKFQLCDKARERRNTDFQFHCGRFIDKTLSRRKPLVCISAANVCSADSPTGYEITCDPVKVASACQDAMMRQVKEADLPTAPAHMEERTADSRARLPPELTAAFQPYGPHPYVQDPAFRHCTWDKEVYSLDMQLRVDRKVRNKSAPGHSGISHGVFVHSCQRLREFERRLIQAMIALNHVPDIMGLTLLFPASKNGADISVIDTSLPKQPMRPILGLECMTKRVEIVCTNYMKDAGLCMGLLDGTSGASTAPSAATATRLVSEDAKASGSPIIALDCDKDNAFVRVPFWQVKLGYQHLGVPLHCIDFMEQLQGNRQYSMPTAYGPTPFTQSVQGTCQGSVLGVLHYAVANYPIQKYYMETGDQYTSAPTNGSPGTQISLTVYVDDERHYFNSNRAMLERLGLMEAFNKHTGARLNPSKTSISYQLPRHIQAPLMTNPQGVRTSVTIASPHHPVKRLGVYDSLEGGCLAASESILTKAVKFVGAIGKTRLPPRQLRYLVNTLLMPSITYQLSASYVPPATLESIDAMLRPLCKHSLGFASSYSNSFFGLGTSLLVGPGFASAVHAGAQSKILTAFSMLNTDAPGGQLLMAALKRYQKQVKRPEFPLLYPPTLLPNLLGLSYVAELADSLLRYNVSMAAPGGDWLATPPRCGDISVASVVKSPMLYQQILNGTCNDPSTANWLWMSTFATPAGTQFASWRSYQRVLVNTPPKAAAPQWYTELKRLVCHVNSDRLLIPMQAVSVFPTLRFKVGDWLVMPQVDAHLQLTDHHMEGDPWLYKVASMGVLNDDTREEDLFLPPRPAKRIHLVRYHRPLNKDYWHRTPNGGQQLSVHEYEHYMTKVQVVTIPGGARLDKHLLFEDDCWSVEGRTRFGPTPRAAYTNMLTNWVNNRRMSLAVCNGCSSANPDRQCINNDKHPDVYGAQFHHKCAGLASNDVAQSECPICIGIPSTRCPIAPVPMTISPLELPLDTDFAGDGSFIHFPVKAAFGAVVASVNPEIVRSQFRLTNRTTELSSHEAELQSMVAANLLAPLNSVGLLLQDSQSAIHAYSKAVNAPDGASQWTRGLSTYNNRFMHRSLLHIKTQRTRLLEQQWVTSHKLEEQGISPQQHRWRTMNDHADRAVTSASASIRLIPPPAYHFPPGADRVGLFDASLTIISSGIRKALQLSKDQNTLEAEQTRATGSAKLLRLQGNWDWESMRPTSMESSNAMKFRLRLLSDSLPTRHRLSQRYPESVPSNCPLCAVDHDPDADDPMAQTHNQDHVFLADGSTCAAGDLLLDQIAATTERVLVKAASHPLVPMGQLSLYDPLLHGTVCNDQSGNPPSLNDKYDPLVSFVGSEDPRLRYRTAPLSTVRSALFSLQVPLAALPAWIQDLRGRPPIDSWSPIPAFWRLLEHQWTVNALLTIRYSPHWPSANMTCIALDTHQGCVYDMQEVLAAKLMGMECVMVDASWDGTSGNTSSPMLSAIFDTMNKSPTLERIIVVTTNSSVPVATLPLDSTLLAHFPSGTFPVVDFTTYMGSNRRHNTTSAHTKVKKAPVYTYCITKQRNAQAQTKPSGWQYEGSNWTTIHVLDLLEPHHELPEFASPPGWRALPQTPSVSTPRCDSISWMGLPRDNPAQATIDLQSHTLLSSLSPLQRRIAMVPVGAHTLLEQLGISMDLQRQTMRKLHSSILSTLRHHWSVHCTWVADFSPLPEVPRSQPAPISEANRVQRMAPLLKRDMKRRSNMADTWMYTREVELGEGEADDADNVYGNRHSEGDGGSSDGEGSGRGGSGGGDSGDDDGGGDAGVGGSGVGSGSSGGGGGGGDGRGSSSSSSSISSSSSRSSNSSSGVDGSGGEWSEAVDEEKYQQGEGEGDSEGLEEGVGEVVDEGEGKGEGENEGEGKEVGQGVGVGEGEGGDECKVESVGKGEDEGNGEAGDKYQNEAEGEGAAGGNCRGEGACVGVGECGCEGCDKDERAGKSEVDDIGEVEGAPEDEGGGEGKEAEGKVEDEAEGKGEDEGVVTTLEERKAQEHEGPRELEQHQEKLQAYIQAKEQSEKPQKIATQNC